MSSPERSPNGRPKKASWNEVEAKTDLLAFAAIDWANGGSLADLCKAARRFRDAVAMGPAGGRYRFALAEAATGSDRGKR
jgi:hypothetical protein